MTAAPPAPAARTGDAHEAGLKAAYKVRSNPGLWFSACAAIQGKTGAPITYPELKLNVFQQEVVDIYRYCMEHALPCRIIILKPRQEGSSTISTAILYNHLRNYTGNGMLIAHEKATTNLLKGIWDRYVEADKFGQWGSVPDKTGRRFSNGSELHLETANDPNAGRGGTWQAILASEVAYYRTSGKASGEAVFESMLNGIHDVPNTLVILESTPNGMEGVYYDTYANAITFEDFKAGKIPKDWNNYIKVFYPWYAFEDTKVDLTPPQEAEVMNSLDQWEQDLLNRWGDQHEITAAHLAWRRRKLKRAPYKHDPSKFNVDYPPDEETCWRTSGSFRFDVDGLTFMDTMALGAPDPTVGTLDDGRTEIDRPKGTGPPVFTVTSQREAWLRVWEKPVVGRRYVLTADFMTGEQAQGALDPDCHAVAVWRDGFLDDEQAQWVPKKVAAIMPLCRVEVDVICRWIGLMARMYGNCIVVPEINNSNGLITLLRRENCNIWHRIQAVEQKAVGTGKQFRKPGWETNANTKPDMIADLAGRIRDEEWSDPCEVARKEYRMFMTYPNGKMAAAPRQHDDWVMGAAIAAKTLPSATVYQEKVELWTPSGSGGQAALGI